MAYFIDAEVGVALNLYSQDTHELCKVNEIKLFYKETFTFKDIFFGLSLHAWGLRDLVLYLSAFDGTENIVIYVSAIIPVKPQTAILASITGIKRH